MMMMMMTMMLVMMMMMMMMMICSLYGHQPINHYPAKKNGMHLNS